MTDAPATAYGPSTITSQPNTDRTTESGMTVHLTPAEARVLRLLPTYLTLAAIGTELGIGRPTVKTHVENIYKKLGATTRAEAVKLAEAARLLPSPRPASE
jgi:DNA-binding CsgD family transcriptional regulator